MVDWPTGREKKGKTKNERIFKLGTMLDWLWPGRRENKDTIRKHRQRLRAALAEIGGLPPLDRRRGRQGVFQGRPALPPQALQEAGQGLSRATGIGLPGLD